MDDPLIDGKRMDPTTLVIEAGREGEDYRLALRGALDLSTASRFDSALETALSSDAKRITVDFDGLAFIDSTGLAQILRATRRADGGRLRMTRGTGEVAQMFRLTALDLVLPFE